MATMDRGAWSSRWLVRWAVAAALSGCHAATGCAGDDSDQADAGTESASEDAGVASSSAETTARATPQGRQATAPTPVVPEPPRETPAATSAEGGGASGPAPDLDFVILPYGGSASRGAPGRVGHPVNGGPAPEAPPVPARGGLPLHGR